MEVNKLKVLYLLREQAVASTGEIIEAHRQSADVTVIDLDTVNDFEALIDLIEQSDTVISC